MGLFQLRPDAREQALQHHLRHIGKAGPGGDGGALAAVMVDIVQDMHPEAEFAVIGPAAGVIEDILKIPRGAEDQVKILPQFIGGGQGGQKIRIQHAVQQHRILRQTLRQVRRGAHDLRQQGKQARMRLEQRE